MVHLQRFKKDRPESGLRHSKGTLNDRACPGMMDVKALGCHTLHRLLVGSDEGEWVLEALSPAVCDDEVPRGG